MVTFQNKENIILRPHLLRQINVKKYLYCTSKKKKAIRKCLDAVHVTPYYVGISI